MGDLNEILLKPISMVSCQKGHTRHAYAWQIGPFWQDALDIYECEIIVMLIHWTYKNPKTLHRP